MRLRGWTDQQVAEARRAGERRPARNNLTGKPATRYIHPGTNRSVVVDDETGEILHVGGDGFAY